MDFKYYSFALFIFILVCAGIWFFAKVVRISKKDEKTEYTKEQRLFKLYQNVEDMMNSFEEYIEETKIQLDQKTADITALLAELNNKVKVIDVEPEKSEKKNSMPGKPPKKSKPVEAEKQNSKPEELISRLIKEGMDRTEIAKKLGMSSREVALIMEIKKIRESEKNS